MAAAAFTHTALAEDPPIFNDSTYGAWRSAQIGGGGYVMNIVPTSDPAVYYVYTDVGGFYRSDDRGQTWRMIHGGLPAEDGNQQPRGVLVHPDDPDLILVATGTHWDARRDGVFRSTDGGQTYTHTLEAAFAGNGNDRMWGTILAVDPSDPMSSSPPRCRTAFIARRTSAGAGPRSALRASTRLIWTSIRAYPAACS